MFAPPGDAIACTESCFESPDVGQGNRFESPGRVGSTPVCDEGVFHFVLQQRREAPRAEFFALPPALNQTGVAEPTPQEHNVSTAFAARSRSIATDHGPPTLEDESASVAPFQTTVLLLRCCFNNQRGRTLPR